MKILSRLALFVAAVLLLTSCARTSNLRTKQNLVSPGQTHEEVLAVLGTPGNKQFNTNQEAWQYYNSGVSGCNYTVVWFTDQKVSALNSYRVKKCLNCANCYKQINWELGPSQVSTQ